MTHTGRHFLQIPGPSNVPDRVLRAMARPVMDHRGLEFTTLAQGVLQDMRTVFQTSGVVVMYPSSGTGAWEAAVVNTLSAGDRAVLFETGHFSQLWREVAVRHGIQVDYVPGTWRGGASAADLEARLAADSQHAIKAVGHCHQKALMKMSHEESLLRKMGVELQSIDSGCCGMAGPFGFQRDHFEVSQAIGERVLLPAVRNAAPTTVIVSDGFSCREQIFQATGRKALHLAEALQLTRTQEASRSNA